MRKSGIEHYWRSVISIRRRICLWLLPRGLREDFGGKKRYVCLPVETGISLSEVFQDSWLKELNYQFQIFCGIFIDQGIIFAPLAMTSTRAPYVLARKIAVWFLLIIHWISLMHLLDGTLPLPKLFPTIYPFPSVLFLIDISVSTRSSPLVRTLGSLSAPSVP